ncbi:MAG: hypothetical protein K2O40_08955, partial [Lachnospiraceae bacterium]|nr:hypothetical protein [Lachnospiraceae bacterium]
NIIKDACSVKYGEPGGKIWLNGEETSDDFDGTCKELSIITNENKQYSITYVELTQMLQYQEFDVKTGDAVTTQQVIASDVTKFEADTSDFQESRTVNIDVEVKDTDSGRMIPLKYTMKSRNDIVPGMKFLATSDEVTIIFMETDIVMVPGETYYIPIMVLGNLTDGLEPDSTENAVIGALTLDQVEVTIPRDTTADTAKVTIRTKDKKSDGSYKDIKSADIRIRRAKSIEVSHTVDRSTVEHGTLEGKNAVYTFSANVAGANLPRVSGASFDSGYQKAQAAYWTVNLRAGGNTYNYTCDFDAESHSYDNQAGMEAYVKIESFQENVDRPSIVMKLMQDMPSDFELTVTATSRHALGKNKAHSRYPDDVTLIQGTDVITPRATVIQDAEITLEPNESGVADLNMFGGIAGSANCVTQGNSDSSTHAEYISDRTSADFGKVKISLGQNEAGSGYSPTGGTSNYTFYVEVHPDGSAAAGATITVHVRRIDEVNFNDRPNAQDPKTLDLLLRYNDTKETSGAIQYLFNEEAAAINVLTTRLTIEVFNNKTPNTPISTQVILCRGYASENRDKNVENAGIVGPYTQTVSKDGKDYYRIVNLKPGRIWHDAAGKWDLRQTPELDIKPLADTPNGVRANQTIRITMEPLHPLGTVEGTSFNNTGLEYRTGVKAVYEIKGTQEIEVPTNLIVVEPGQGMNVDSQLTSTRTEVVIPITVPGAEKVLATISGNSSKDTKLSYYGPENANPYNDPVGGSSWYLGLEIGKEETGKNHTGLIDVQISAYGSDDRLISTANLQLAVRRVEQVDLKVAKDSEGHDVDIKDVNKSGSVVTLEACPTGFGKDGIEYYGIQRFTADGKYYFGKNQPGEICRWETMQTNNEVAYKSPIPMKWSLVINGTERPVEQCTDYIETGTISIQEDEENYKNVIQFKLKKALPKGTEIRATALHTLGSAGDKKYNKSNQEYGKQYGSLIITGGGRRELGGFKRANRQNWDLPGFEAGTIPAFKAKYFNQNGFEQYTFYRFREEGGVWTQYYKTDDNENYHAYVTGSKMGRLFRTDKAYDLDVINVLYNTNEKKIYWPQDRSLVDEVGTGWREAGYTLKDWDYDSRLTAEEKSFECKQEYYIPKTEMWVGPKAGYKTIEKSTHDPISSEASPIQVKGGGLTDGSRGEQFAVVMEPTAFDLPAAYANFTAILEKKTASGWGQIETNNMQQIEKWNLRTQNPEIMAESTYGARGLYKISCIVKNMDWVDVSGDMFAPTYTTSYETLPLYEDNGAGIIYLEFVD